MPELKSDLSLIRKYYGDELTDYDKYVDRHNVKVYEPYDEKNHGFRYRLEEIVLSQKDGVVEVSAVGLKFAEIDIIRRTITIYRKNIKANANWYLERTISEIIQTETEGWSWLETYHYGKERVFLTAKGQHPWSAIRRFGQKNELQLKHMVLLDADTEMYKMTFDGQPLSANLIKYNTKGQVKTKW